MGATWSREITLFQWLLKSFSKPDLWGFSSLVFVSVEFGASLVGEILHYIYIYIY